MENVDLELQIATQSKQIVLVAAILLIVLIILSIALRDRVPKLKPVLFGLLSATLILPTLYMIASTIYVNVKSESGGPVHWHAGVEFWACGTELDLRNPSGALSNKVGTSTYHEHDDKYIHLEGVVMQKNVDASLGKFLRVTGGYLTSDTIGIPLTADEAEWFVSGDKLDGDLQGNMSATDLAYYVNQATEGPVAEFSNGQSCGKQPAEVQVFAYTYNEADKTYSQRKLEDPANYVIRDESSLGPPSDCIIVEFDTPKERTDKLCEQYGIKDIDRCESFGVKKGKESVCEIQEVSKELNNG